MATIIQPIMPGIGIGPDSMPYFCPGCWAEDTGQPVPEGKALLEWFERGVWVLESCGFKFADGEASNLARLYEEDPWHV